MASLADALLTNAGKPTGKRKYGKHALTDSLDGYNHNKGTMPQAEVNARTAEVMAKIKAHTPYDVVRKKQLYFAAGYYRGLEEAFNQALAEGYLVKVDIDKEGRMSIYVRTEKK